MRPVAALLLALFLPVASPASPARAETDTCRVVRTRMAAELLEGSTAISEAKSSLASLRPDGSWPDIPYANQDRSLWRPIRHLERLSAMSEAYRKTGSELRGNAALKRAIVSGLAFWLGKDPTSPNWWWNTIGMQQELYKTLLLMRDDLPPDEFKGGCALMARSHTHGFTGANLSWEAGNLFTLGALTGDEGLMQRMLAVITQDITVSTAEGVQPDWSFHQHGPQLNAGNYGIGFLQTCGRYSTLVQGTSLQLPLEKISILTHFIADFQDWVVWGKYMDLSSCGRQLDMPKAQAGKAADIARCAERLLPLDSIEAPVLESLIQRVDGVLSPESRAPIGDRYYWRSDFLVHRPGKWYLSVKMFSPRVLRTETAVNSENLKGYHLCDGMTMILVRGDEYADIQPAWDWRKLPGVTFKETSAPYPYGKNTGTEHNPNPFVGGASDGMFGVATMDIAKEDVRAKKSWFCFEDEAVCLGTDIRSESAEKATTSVNQCLLRGPVWTLEGGAWSEHPGGRSESSSLQAVWHDDVGYLFPEPARTVLYAGAQTGSWAELRKEGVSKVPVTKNVFSLWFDHGPRPSGASYAYAIVPDIDRSTVERLAKSPDFRIISNSADLQAVQWLPGNVIETVFRRPGVLTSEGEDRLSVDAPCVVIARPIAGGLELAVADPTETLPRVSVIVSGRYTGRDCVVSDDGTATRLRVNLPQGPLAGLTVVRGLVPQ